MASWTVIIETRGGGGPGARERFEITPPPAPGEERAVLRQLVTGIHPGAVERGHSAGRSLFDDGGRSIAAHFEVVGDDPGRAAGPGPPEDAAGQGTLFDA